MDLVIVFLFLAEDAPKEILIQTNITVEKNIFNLIFLKEFQLDLF